MCRNFSDSVQVLECNKAFQTFFGAFQNFNEVLEKSDVKPSSLQPHEVVILRQYPVN